MALALAALRERSLARVYLVPAAQSPFKKRGAIASVRERAALVRAAIRGRPGLSLGAWEIGRAGPSYTYQTLRFLRKKFPKRRWELILGEDVWRTFSRWRRGDEIGKHCTVVVGRRAHAGRPPVSTGAVFLRTRIPAVSSTEIRCALRDGRSVRRWVGDPVAEKIEKMKLYRNLE